MYGSSAELFSVKGKNALVTGGTKGLGREMALCLLENGCNVMVCSRDVSGCEALVEAGKKFCCNLHTYACDITDTSQVIDLVKHAQKVMGSIDILINSAGMNAPKMLPDMDDATWDRILNLNLRATFIVIREVSKVMRPQRYGKIINISSMKAFLGVSDAGYTAYCASKGGINMLTKQIACELAADGITVNAIAPTFIRTKINEKQLDNPVFRAALEARIPVGRVGQFRDLMGLMLLFASDASQFITGQIVRLDGGISARQ